ncbi:hypothetical protein Tco_1254162 [Tanacetum coccineum]
MVGEQQEDQQQQQNMLDVILVPIDEQGKIGLKNYMIAFEKSTVDALEIYMQQFWHIIHYDLTAKAYHFKIDDQTFEVNVDLLNKLMIRPLK